MRKSTLAEEKEESPKGKRCKIISQSYVSSTGCNTKVVLNSLLPKSLPINNFSIFKVDSGSSRAVSIPGARKRKKRKNIQNTHIHISGQISMRDYLKVPKTISRQKTMLTYSINICTTKDRVFLRDLCRNHQNQRQARNNLLSYQCNQPTHPKL